MNPSQLSQFIESASQVPGPLLDVILGSVTPTSITKVENRIVDEETGEVLGVDPKFHVTDTRTAEWALKKILDADAEVAKFKTVKANAEAMLKSATDQKQWLLMRFENELGEWSKQERQRTGQKTLTVKTLYGSVQVTKDEGGDLRVQDNESAVNLIERHLGNDWQGLVETSKEFKISLMTEKQKELMSQVLKRELQSDDKCGKLAQQAFTLTKPGEKVHVKSAFGKAAK